jgi:preprotein translocase subunit YajC
MAAPVQPSLAESLGQMVPLFLVFGAAMWFLSIRPAMKRQKEQESLQKSLQKGDKVLVQAGFYAVVDEVKENGNVFLVFGGSRVEFQRQAIVSKVEG